jgi:hypothetical protein
MVLYVDGVPYSYTSTAGIVGIVGNNGTNFYNPPAYPHTPLLASTNIIFGPNNSGVYNTWIQNPMMCDSTQFTDQLATDLYIAGTSTA